MCIRVYEENQSHGTDVTATAHSAKWYTESDGNDNEKTQSRTRDNFRAFIDVLWKLCHSLPSISLRSHFHRGNDSYAWVCVWLKTRVTITTRSNRSTWNRSQNSVLCAHKSTWIINVMNRGKQVSFVLYSVNKNIIAYLNNVRYAATFVTAAFRIIWRLLSVVWVCARVHYTKFLLVSPYLTDLQIYGLSYVHTSTHKSLRLNVKSYKRVPMHYVIELLRLRTDNGHRNNKNLCCCNDELQYFKWCGKLEKNSSVGS